MQKIIPCLWFDGEAEAAAAFYVSLFPEARIDTLTRYGKAGFEIHGQPEGRVMTVEFELAGYRMCGLNGGPHFRFTPAISFFVVLETEPAVDALWASLSSGGSVMMPLQAYEWSRKYGWLTDRYGVSWQVALGTRAEVGQTITPSLLFTGAQHGRAEEALNHYTALFGPSRVDGILRHEGPGPDRPGTVKHAQFHLNGEAFMVMDSALPHESGFNEAVSLVIRCDSQAEIDRFWSALSAVPEAEQCGWLKDRFGVSWQVTPGALYDMMADPEPARVDRVMQAVLRMHRLDLAALQRAYAG